MGQLITDIDILVPYKEPPNNTPDHVPTGWTPIPVNLNSGAGGACLYLVYERHTGDQAITGLRILKGEERPPAGYQKLPIDLNKGIEKGVGPDKKIVKATALYLAVTREGGEPIADLDIVHWSKSGDAVKPKEGYRRLQRDGADADLNFDAGGDFVYLDYRPAPNLQEKA
ncbi:hypothetical protein [Kitasatospora sp. NPDC089509]|uniref:hypothetical protein n=1 Tax=Kitasatospora sp. NPDC089509 TaxID=3364079 RepID=UPI0038076143